MKTLYRLDGFAAMALNLSTVYGFEKLSETDGRAHVRNVLTGEQVYDLPVELMEAYFSA